MDVTNMITLTEYAARHGLNPVTVRRKCLRGNVPGAVKMGPRAWLIPADAPYTDHRIKTGKYIDARKPAQK